MKRGLICVIILLAVTGCWDQRLLKEYTLIKATSIDITDEGRYITTVSAPLPGGEGEGDQVVSAEGNTMGENKILLNRKMPEQVDDSKLRILLLGERAVEEDIFPYLDRFYRDPQSALDARVAVVKDKAQEALFFTNEHKPETPDYISELMESGEVTTLIPKLNIQFICPLLFDEGQDLLLPGLRIAKNDIEIDGLIMFDGRNKSGELTPEESTLFLLWNNQMGKDAEFTFKVGDQKERNLNFIHVSVMEMTRDIDVKVDDFTQEVNVFMNMELMVNVEEYPPDDLLEREVTASLNQLMEQQLEEQSKELFDKMKQVNCDGLGIGRKIIANDYDYWESVEWSEIFPTVNFHPDVTVEIEQTGIVN
ncbi:Ger(x)C family spore germination protein [Bacillus sp. FJAT-44742]|uniref:Ger(x)C family spore germination protein n=1 Tax=Bacillus sp. FJAT-44742 TaxID=2014005 RepID=UPI000C24B412|nr:Ger(x)C family spore germination protein [Bacillus sp. FJAT-44742]